MQIPITEGQPITLRRTRGDKTVVWTIRFDGATIIKTWGQEGGKEQTVTDTEDPVNVGTAGERSGKRQAELRVAREIRKRIENGYIPTSFPQESAPDVIDPVMGPPSKFRGPKPQNSTPKSLMKLWGTDELSLLRKHDGMCFPIFINKNGEPVVFSRRFLPTSNTDTHPWGDRFPHITEKFRKLGAPIKSYSHGDERLLPPTVPAGTVFMTEMIAPWWSEDDQCHDDDFNYVGHICRAATDVALESQSTDEYLVCVVLDLWMWGGEDALSTMTFAERREILERVLPQEQANVPVFLVSDEYEKEGTSSMSVEEVLDFAKDMKWEGFVLVNRTKAFPEGTLNFTGAEKRPVTYGKLKPMEEDDFIALWDPSMEIGSFGKGKHQNQIGAIALFQLDGGGKMHFVSNCGIGLSDKQKKDWADPDKGWPKIVQVEYFERTAKGSLRSPNFLRERPDKLAGECRLPAKEKE